MHEIFYYFTKTTFNDKIIMVIYMNVVIKVSDETKEKMIDYYKDKGLLVNIDKISNPEETFTEIEKVIK